MTIENENIAEDQRIKRQERLIDSKIANLAKVLKEMQDAQEAIALEVLEFKVARVELNSTLQSSIKDSMATLTPALAKTLKIFLEETNIKLTESFKGSLKSVQQEAEATILALKEAQEKEKKFFFFKGLMRNGIGLLSAALVAVAIFYFFPQTQHIHSDMTAEHLQDMLYGRVLRNNKNSLKEETKGIIADGLAVEMTKYFGLKKQ